MAAFDAGEQFAPEPDLFIEMLYSKLKADLVRELDSQPLPELVPQEQAVRDAIIQRANDQVLFERITSE